MTYWEWFVFICIVSGVVLAFFALLYAAICFSFASVISGAGAGSKENCDG